VAVISQIPSQGSVLKKSESKSLGATSTVSTVPMGVTRPEALNRLVIVRGINDEGPSDLLHLKKKAA
jgi:hypothetical protein